MADARPYLPYRRGDAWVFADGGPFDVIPAAQRAVTITRDVRGADGLVMHKHLVPLKRKRPEFPPQLRPTPMELPDGTKSIKVHDHADPWLTGRGLQEHVAGKQHHGVDVHGLHDNYQPELHLHADMTPRAREDHVAGKQHHGVDTDELHEKDVEGKYKLPASPLKDVRSFHAHPCPVKVEKMTRRGVKRITMYCRHKPTCGSDLEHTVRHVAKYDHLGEDFLPDSDLRRGVRAAFQVGIPVDEIVKMFGAQFPPDGELHAHNYRDKDRDAPSYAKRIDVHPLAVPLLETARIVYFSIEGNLKADAILTDILRRGVEDEAVVDVPSVGQWRAEELDDFAREWLHGRTVIIVCDSDWSDPGKFDVQRQAFAFREYLRRRIGRSAVHVAAPPSPEERDRWGWPVKVGVDDWLGHAPLKDDDGTVLRESYGGTLDGLIVVERETSPKMREWQELWAPGRRSVDGDLRERKSEARLMELMALISDADGRGRSSIKALSAFTSLARNTVSRAFDALAEESGTMGESPLEWVERITPTMGYKGSRVVTTTEDGGPLQDIAGPRSSSRVLQDTLEWQIANGYRWRERTPRRTLGEII